ncbi:MAG: SRPBCC domain-containing protein [Bacteroidetes bacterium]|nr:SRPBCC domain-containing protein [Bacteroidota bacterium]
MSQIITVNVAINAPLALVWEKWNNPNDMLKWNHASDDWHTVKANNEITLGGIYFYRMEAKDGSMGFDFNAKYTTVKPLELLEYTMEDNRTVSISFDYKDGVTSVKESFMTEDVNSAELQRQGWQAILNNFKLYAES